MKNLIHEIHRRSLWQVLGIYLVVGWIGLQVVDVLVQNMGLPEWVFPFAIVLLVIGLPIVMATAFVQEGLGSGVRATAAETATPEARPTAPRKLFTWRNAIGGGVAASLLWGGVAIGWFVFGRGADGGSPLVAEVSAADLRSVAVLPFATRAEAGESADVFAEGMHDDVLTQLSKIDSLTVISRTSVMQYAGTTKPIPEIAAELGVATVLEGGVQRAGERVRVNVQLIDAATDKHLWAETYDQELTAANVFAIQSDLARKIAVALRARLTPEVEARIEARPTESLEAYDLYTRGQVLWGRSTTRNEGEAAADLFREAIRVDPGYASAYAALSGLVLGLANRARIPMDQAMAEARPAVERALQLDPTLADAHWAQGQLMYADLRYAEAEQAYKRAIDLNPGYAQAFSSYGALLADVGRFEEAIVMDRRAVELNPLSRSTRANLAFDYAMTRDFERAADQGRKLVQMEPDYPYGYYVLGAALSFKGEHEEAVAASQTSVELDPGDLYNAAGLAYANARAGHRDRALELVADVEERGGELTPWSEIAWIYAALGDRDRAFEYLNRAYETRPGSLRLMGVDPSADPLRDDPRFAELLQKLGLE
jgi:TolB-like protein/Tfp pilus assembly protein PilF